jgi:hypothetical protein
MRAALYVLAPLGFLAAALALFWTLLPACGLREALRLPVGATCPAAAPSPAASALGREAERRAALAAELRGLERRLLALGPCEVAPLPPEPGLPLPSEAAAPSAPLPPARPEPPAAPAPDAIDPERWRERDVSLLEGCWMLDSDYSVTNVDTGQTLNVSYWRACFDAGGRGSQELRFSNGATCEAPMRAEFRGEELRLHDGANVACSDGSELFERTIDCRLDDQGRAQCLSRQGERGGAANVRLRRAG